VLPMKPAPPVTTMRRLADIIRRRRSMVHGPLSN